MSLLSEEKWNLTAVVMAAGLSRRMGADKLHLPLEGKPMFQYVVELVAQLPFAARRIVTNQRDIAAYAEEWGLQVIPSPHAALGMGYSVAAGTQAVDKSTDGILFLNADQPFLTKEILQELYGIFMEKDQIIVPCIEGRKGSPCIFPMRFWEELCTLQGDKGGRQVYARHPDETFFAEQAQDRGFADLDVPADYRACQE